MVDSEKLLRNIDYTCRHLYPTPKVLITNYPHNPSTATVGPEFYVEVVKLAKKYGFLVISDLAYSDVTFDGYKCPSFLAVPGAIDVGVELTTMSKGYNMAGWRIGFCAGNSEIIRALATIKTYYDYGMFQPIQICGHHGLAPHGRSGRGTIGRLSEPPRCLVRRSGAAWLADRKAKSDHVRLGKNPATMGRPHELFRICTETAPRGRRFRQPGAPASDPAGEGYLRMALVENENRLRQAVRANRPLPGDQVDHHGTACKKI